MSRTESIKTTSLMADIKYSVWDDITREMQMTVLPQDFISKLKLADCSKKTVERSKTQSKKPTQE